jgi:2-polyprenyl-3-methyl-5-hydroxy-6-metoxy-1,4-benzoquinol methylase
MSALAPRSPLSPSPPQKVRDLPRDFILEQLAVYYKSQPPPQAVECDYSLWRCVETGLEFAWPMLPGNAVFYKWISSFASYYPVKRWEYPQMSRLIEHPHSADQSLNVLDVGCGNGDFLLGLNIPPQNKFALDMNQPAIEECRRRGFNAFCGTIESARSAGAFDGRKFDAVTSFHCLEHVENPVEFVRSLAGITRSGGRIFLSTPYSPMSFEAYWFDIMNHPPHHLTRWNLAAYRRLAATLGFSMRYFAPRFSGLKKAISAFRFSQYGFPHGNAVKAKLLQDLLLHFSTFARFYRDQLKRPAEVHADVILIEFTIA